MTSETKHFFKFCAENGVKYLYSFEWTFESFYNMKDETEFQSPKFKTQDDRIWHVTFEKLIFGSKFRLCFYTSEKDEIYFRVIAFLQDAHNSTISNEKFGKSVVKENAFAFEFDEVYSRLNNGTHRGKIILHFEKKYHRKVLTLENFNPLFTLHPSNSGLLTLSANLKKLFESSVGSDVTFRIQETTFQAHKSILMAGSVVFERMFQNRMKESVTNVIEIEDITPDVFKILLEYLYTGVCPDCDFITARALHYAADKYSVLELKKLLLSQKLSKITPENSVLILSVADEFGDENTKIAASEFIKSYLYEIPNID